MTSTGAAATDTKIGAARAWVALALSVALLACTSGPSPLEQAATSYHRQHRDYESLEIVAQHLSAGLVRGEVERLLREADYSPTAGLYYCSSAKKKPSEQHGSDVTLGLVVDYRDKRGTDTKSLQKYQLGPLDE